MEKRVRETEEIRFALNVFTAINSDNYIKFFRLARRATLLQGCILLRYFYQVRANQIYAEQIEYVSLLVNDTRKYYQVQLFIFNLSFSI